MSKVLMKGNEAIGEAAIRAGCLNYFAYPITPQTEVAEYLSKRMAEVDGVFLQGESEVAVSYMIFGASACGERVFTTSSSPGISLMSEGISYITAAECPTVFVNIMRGGPGLGGILPSQADYFQATKGGGHGDYRLLVMAPASVQEAVEMVMQAFALADKYRNPVMVLGDGLIGQMMEPVEFPERLKIQPTNKDDWATNGMGTRKSNTRNLVKTLYLDPEALNAPHCKAYPDTVAWCYYAAGRTRATNLASMARPSGVYINPVPMSEADSVVAADGAEIVAVGRLQDRVAVLTVEVEQRVLALFQHRPNQRRFHSGLISGFCLPDHLGNRRDSRGQGDTTGKL